MDKQREVFPDLLRSLEGFNGLMGSFEGGIAGINGQLRRIEKALNVHPLDQGKLIEKAYSDSKSPEKDELETPGLITQAEAGIEEALRDLEKFDKKLIETQKRLTNLCDILLGRGEKDG